MGRFGGYGYVRDLPDHNDLPYAGPLLLAPLPPRLDVVNEHMPPIYDQGQLGSCTLNAGGAMWAYVLHKHGLAGESFRMPSRLFGYYEARKLEGTVDSDAGAVIRDVMKVLRHFGLPPEDLWPYNVARFADEPPLNAYSAAALAQVIEYRRVPLRLATMKQCLAEGYPFEIGFTVYSSFESEQVAHTGIAPMPSPGEGALGGHAVLVVGYDDADGGGRFLVRNSWGVGWGRAGYFTVPYAFFTDSNYAGDCWTIRKIEQ